MGRLSQALGILAGRKPPVPRPADIAYEKLEVRPRTAVAMVTVGVVLLAVAVATSAVMFGGVNSAEALVSLLFDQSTSMAPYVAAFLASLVPPLLVLAWVLRTDKYEPEPKYLITAMFGVGAAMSAFASPIVVFSDASLTPLLAPIIYEVLKVAGLTMLFTSRYVKEVNDHLDGFVYGAAVGAGFAVVNSAVAFLNAYLTPDVARGLSLFGVPVAGLVASQALTSTFHILSTGLAGFWLGYVRVVENGVSGRDMGPALVIALAVGYLSMLPTALDATLSVAIRAVLAAYLLFVAGRLLRAALMDEVAWGYAAGRAPVEA